MKEDYSDIIDLPHHKSSEHPWMPQEDRAVQFSPFAALAGFDLIIRETAEKHTRRIEEKRSSEFDE